MYKNLFSRRAFDDPSAKRLCPVTPFASDGQRQICLPTIDEDVYFPTFSNIRVWIREQTVRLFAMAFLCYRQAWNRNSSQYLCNLHQLLNRDRFEQIASFLHVVTVTEEAQLSRHRLKKILPLHEHVKRKCPQIYQPLQQLPVDEKWSRVKRALTSGST